MGNKAQDVLIAAKPETPPKAVPHARRALPIAMPRMPTRSKHSRTVRARSPAVFWPLILRGHATARLLAHTCSHKAAMS